MASKGLRATFVSPVAKVGADYGASQTSETLISYDRVLPVVFHSLLNINIAGCPSIVSIL